MRPRRSWSVLSLTLMLILPLITACTIARDQPKLKQKTATTEELITPTAGNARFLATTPYSTATALSPTATAILKQPTNTSSPVIATPTPTARLNAKGSIVMAGSLRYGEGIYLYDLENNNLKNLTDEPQDGRLYFDPSWSPDGSQIVYSHGRENTYLFVYRFSTNAIEKIPMRTKCNLNYEPDWSPDGKSIVFAVCWDIYLYTFSNQSLTQLIHTIDPNYARKPIWSPDGNRIAFLGSNGQEKDNTRIFIMDKNGQNRKEIAPDVSIGWGKISWSPDGQSIAFRSNEGCGDICTVNINDGTEQCLTHTPSGERDPDWSPDGQFIAYVATYETKLCNQASGGEPLMLGWQLHILQVNTGQDETLTNNPGANFTSPDWLP